MKTVKLPKWWTESKSDVLGTTDGLVTYCASATPCYYVSVPEFEYEGYFQVSDLEVLS